MDLLEQDAQQSVLPKNFIILLYLISLNGPQDAQQSIVLCSFYNIISPCKFQ
jgi:hypothetical protein